MYKRIFHIVIACVVGLTVLTSAIVPHHHHHQASPCFSLILCEEGLDCSVHHIQSEPDGCVSHHHEGNADSKQEDDCVLSYFVVFSPNSSRIQFIVPSALFFPDVFLPTIFPIVKYDFSLPETASQSRQIPYLINDYNALISRSSGLRAPPSLLV